MPYCSTDKFVDVTFPEFSTNDLLVSIVLMTWMIACVNSLSSSCNTNLSWINFSLRSWRSDESSWTRSLWSDVCLFSLISSLEISLDVSYGGFTWIDENDLFSPYVFFGWFSLLLEIADRSESLEIAAVPFVVVRLFLNRSCSIYFYCASAACVIVFVWISTIFVS